MFCCKCIGILTVLFVICAIARGDNLGKSHNETKDIIEARGKQSGGGGMVSRILPFMIIPFMISTAIIPKMLVALKFMLLKSAFIGKLALIMLILNMLRSRNSGQGGVFTHNAVLKEMPMAHYGYTGEEEYGAWVNRNFKL